MPEPSLRFEEFELDIEGCELRRSGRPVKLERIPMELLVLLLQNPGKLLRRETIEQKLWGENGMLETEHSINTAVNKLRATLRDDSRDPHFIRTVIGQGYRFIADVTPAEPIRGPATSAQSAGFFSLGCRARHRGCCGTTGQWPTGSRDQQRGTRTGGFSGSGADAASASHSCSRP